MSLWMTVILAFLFYTQVIFAVESFQINPMVAEIISQQDRWHVFHQAGATELGRLPKGSEQLSRELSPNLQGVGDKRRAEHTHSNHTYLQETHDGLELLYAEVEKASSVTNCPAVSAASCPFGSQAKTTAEIKVVAEKEDKFDGELRTVDSCDHSQFSSETHVNQHSLCKPFGRQ